MKHNQLLLEKIRESLAATGPITAIVLAIAVTIAPLTPGTMVLFLFGAALLVIGMGTAYLPTEFLPAYWQDLVYPWDPLRFMTDGFRGVLYMGQGFWNSSSPALLVMAAIGLGLMGIKFALNLRGVRQVPESQAPRRIHNR